MKRMKDMRKWIFRILGVVCVVVSVSLYALAVSQDADTTMTVLATLFLIGGITLFIMATAKSYNNSCDTIKRVDDAGKITIEEVYHALENLDTSLGKPWMGGIVSISQPCIIWGPNQNEELICAYKTKLTGSIYIAMYQGMGYISKEAEDKERFERNWAEHEARYAKYENGSDLDYQELLCYKLSQTSLLDDLRYEINLYVREHRIAPLPGQASRLDAAPGRLYRFDEDFKWTGQAFSLCTMDGTPVYNITGTFPLKTFSIREADSGREVFNMKKRLLHILTHYDFYLEGQKFATFRKKFDLVHDTFTMKTSEGELTMRSVNATIGHNYQVMMNGEVVGNICEKMNLTLENIVYDNFVLYVREEKYRLIITALAVMAAREMARERASEQDD